MRTPRDLQAANHQQDEQGDHEHRADEAEFLADDREDTVGMRRGQKAEFLLALPQADARPAAV